MGNVRVRGLPGWRRKPRKRETDWDAVGALMATADMDEEELDRFLWVHPEVERVRGIYERDCDKR